MSGAAIASVFALGPRVTAQVLGLPFAQYRPSGAGAALASANLLGTVPAWITADPKLMAARPFNYAKPAGYAAVDPAIVAVGDYLVGSLTVGGEQETFFVASADIPAPIMVIRCNRVLTVTRPGGPAPGADYYGGDTTATETPLITAWPASVLQGTKGERGDLTLPGDVRNPWGAILLPPSVPVQLRFADVALDDQPQPVRYVLSNVEQTAIGLRITANMAVP